MYRVWVRIIHLTMAPTLHIFELKYAPTHGTFPSFLEMDKTAGAYSLQIYNYLNRIQLKTKAFLLIIGHNSEDCQYLTGSDVIECSFSSSDLRIDSTLYYSLNHDGTHQIVLTNIFLMYVFINPLQVRKVPWEYNFATAYNIYEHL